MEGRPRVLTSAPSSGGGFSTGAVLVPLIALVVGIVIGVLVAGGDGENGEDEGAGATSSVHSQAGAAATAADDVQRLSLDVVLDPEARQRTLSEIGTPSFAESESAKLEDARTGRGGRLLEQSSSSGGVFGQAVPLRYSVTSYTPRRAVVRVWTMTVLAGGRVDPGAQFAIGEYSLVWRDDRWLLDASSVVREGPTPGVLQRELTRRPSALIDALRGYREVSREAP